MPNIDISQIRMPKAGERTKRVAAARAKVEAKAAKRADPENILKGAIRHHGLQEHDLRGKVRTAEDHKAMLVLKLAGLQDVAARMAEAAYLKGEAASDFHKIKADVAFLPDLIERADREVQAAVDRLTDHQARAPGREIEPAPAPAPAPSVRKMRAAR